MEKTKLNMDKLKAQLEVIKDDLGNLSELSTNNYDDILLDEILEVMTIVKKMENKIK